MGKGLYSIKCSSIDEKASILANGPWCIQNHHVWVQAWEPGFKPSKAKCNIEAVWVKLPELPFKLFDRNILLQVGRMLGKLVKIDNNTVKGEGKRFTNLCVLIDAESQPLTGIWLGNVLQDIKYLEGSWYYPTCNKFGHGSRNCGTAQVESNPEHTRFQGQGRNRPAAKEMEVHKAPPSQSQRWTPVKPKYHSLTKDNHAPPPFSTCHIP